MVSNIIWDSARINSCSISFNIFLADLFLVVKEIDIAIYADYSTTFIVEENTDVIASLEEASNVLFDWFGNNCLTSNADKCHALVITDKPVDFKIGYCIIDNSDCEKPLGVKIEVNLSFNNRMSDLLNKVSRKISA